MYTVFKISLLLIASFIIISCCNKKGDLKNKISITVIALDKYSKLPISKDTIEVRISKWGIPMRKYVKIGTYITDSLGKVKIILDKNERYSFTFIGLHTFASTEFSGGKLKNGQKLIIEVVPQEKKKIPW